ncbi:MULTISPECIES: alpha/beta fold hydrolase [Mumia]|uniref:alpha/beta fold hydrolase n=1 Tax=Mumia TaxID=1546255 RepID=UPI0014215085|nr:MULTISPECIES: alpha/beta fold hydrolase [unclassified Mumia]QMW67643.1 alpha/beta fold hydrolase [Mumia sp. ZJ1417]
MSEPDESGPLRTRFVSLHGHRRAYRMAGQGPALLLLHGLGCDSTTWLPVMGRLADRFRVIAPDFLGHGESDKPRGDYSLGGYANAMRDLLAYLEIERVTIVGHSFGGGVAMQFAYQYPERTERICLVAPGGLGADVTPLIRLLTVPGAGLGLRALTVPPLRGPVRAGLRALSRSGLPYTRDLDEVAGVYSALCDPGNRAAVRAATSHVVDWRGQRITMTDRAYLAEVIPLCLVWGEKDAVIPARHALVAQRRGPHTVVRLFPDSGHFPHKDEPDLFVDVLTAFVDEQPAATYRPQRWRAILRSGARAEGADSVEAAAAVVDLTADAG